MSRDEFLYLEDIREACEKILRFTKGMAYKDFMMICSSMLFCATWKSSVKL